MFIRLKIMLSISCVFGHRLARVLDLNNIMDYFMWDWRFNEEFIYDYIKEKL